MERDNNPDRLDDGARAEAEMKERWEAFQDAAYFDLWCVRPKGESRFGEGFHVQSKAEADALVAALSASTALPAPQGDDTLVGEVLANIEQWNKWAAEWAGSAFVAGERLPKDGMTESEHKSELYSGLCKMMNHMSWLHDQVTTQAAEIAGLKADLDLAVAMFDERNKVAIERAGNAVRAAAAESLLAEAREALEKAEADKARLDFLDNLNRRLNDHYGTNYRWEMIINQNVNRLMLRDLKYGVDLNDAKAHGFNSCRDVIDREMNRIAAGRSARATLSRLKPGEKGGSGDD